MKKVSICLILWLMSMGVNAQVQKTVKTTIKGTTTDSVCVLRATKKCRNQTFGLGDNFPSAQISQMNFSGSEFLGTSNAKLDLRHVYAHKTDFSKTNLEWVMLGGAELYDADFSESTLSDTFLDHIKGHGIDFHKATLERTNLNEAELDQANFQDSKLTTVSMLGRAEAINADFQRSTIDGLKANQLQAKDVNFMYAKITNSEFNNAQLQSADFTCAVLNKVQLKGVKGKEMSFVGARILGGSLESFTNSSFERSLGQKLCFAHYTDADGDPAVAQAHCNKATRPDCCGGLTQAMCATSAHGCEWSAANKCESKCDSLDQAGCATKAECAWETGNEYCYFK